MTDFSTTKAIVGSIIGYTTGIASLLLEETINIEHVSPIVKIIDLTTPVITWGSLLMGFILTCLLVIDKVMKMVSNKKNK